jgi:hypothetical protein
MCDEDTRTCSECLQEGRFDVNCPDDRDEAADKGPAGLADALDNLDSLQWYNAVDIGKMVSSAAFMAA